MSVIPLRPDQTKSFDTRIDKVEANMQALETDYNNSKADYGPYNERLATAEGNSSIALNKAIEAKGKSDIALETANTTASKIETIKIDYDTFKNASLAADKVTYFQGEINKTNEQLNDIVPNKIPKMKGVCLYFKTDTDINNVSDSILNVIKNDGVTDIMLCPLLTCNDTVNYNSVSQGYTKATLTTLVNKLVGLGFNVSLKMHLNMADGSSIYLPNSPTDASALFSNLRTIYLDNLSISQNFKLLCLANESPKITQNYRTNWQSLISAIRSQNPTLKITNSPTFDDIYNDKCVFWDLCDFIGCNVYVEGVSDQVPSVYTFKKAVNCDSASPMNHEFVVSFYNLCKKYNKPFILTEWAILPYEYQGKKTSSWQALGAYNETVQANYYEAMLSVFMNMDLCTGIFIWNCTDSFTFINRTAEQVVKKYYGGVS